jgi:CheY-like chemotaxis protein
MSQRTVLLVEDDPGVREAVRLGLEHLGYAVSEAEAGAAALDLAECQQPDLILLDLGLRDTDGLEVAQELRRRPKTTRIPIVVLTGQALSRRRTELAESVSAGIITKPFGLERLGRDLRALLPVERRGVRRFPRYPVEAPVYWRLRVSGDACEPAFAAGTGRMLSEAGLMAELPRSLAVTSLLELRVRVPTGAVAAVSEVVWTGSRDQGPTQAGSHQHGIQFLDLAPGGREAIRQLADLACPENTLPHKIAP